MLEQCTKSKNHQKVVTRHVREEHKEKVRLNRLSKSGKLLYNYRKEKVERSFADSKELHGLRYPRLRGLKRSYGTSITYSCSSKHKEDRNASSTYSIDVCLMLKTLILAVKRIKNFTKKSVEKV